MGNLTTDKKVKILHFASQWKEIGGDGCGKLHYDMIKNEEARNYIINLTK
jgi:hypothetical protein